VRSFGARQFLRTNSYAFALLLTVVLLVANIIALPEFVSWDNIPGDLAVFAPFALAAMASTPSILSGGGGLDISVGPIIALINIVFVVDLMGHGLGGWEAVPILLVLGTALGAVNGFFVTVLRYQPVIATLCAFLIISGFNLKHAGSPVSAPHNWTADLAEKVGPVPGALFTILAPVLFWILLKRTAYYRTLYAVGGNDATAFSSGVNVYATRIIAYALGGLFAAVAGIALTALTHNADANLGAQYTLIALGAVAIGGTPIGGGRGGLVGSILGAATIYLLQNLLAALHVNVKWLFVVYGILLLLGLMIGARLVAPPRTRGAT
jgi:ribose transport system permease protein